MSRKPKTKPSCEIYVFPHSRLIGTARRLIDQAETKSDAEMSVMWERQMDALEAQMIRCGIEVEKRAVQLHVLYTLVQSESHRRAYEGRRSEPDEAA